MAPAQQGLEAGDGAVLEPDDRLEMHLDLVAVHRAPQVGLERQALGPVRPHRRPEGLDAVAARALGMGHGDFGVLQHALARRMELRVE